MASGTKKRAFSSSLTLFPTQKKKAFIITLKENIDSLEGAHGTSDNWNERRIPRVYSRAMSYQSQTQRASDNPPSTDAPRPLQTSILS